MPRTERIVVVGFPHHVTQKGNYNQTVFRKESDYRRYLLWLEGYKNKYRLLILAYCLMPNHIHLIVVPEKEDSLSKTIKDCHMRYAQYINNNKKVTGHLWHGRFYSCILDEKHLYSAIRYVENNPVRAKLAVKAEDWKWSSAKSHLYNTTNLLSLGDISRYMEIPDWRGFLTQNHEESCITKIRSNTHSGKPIGSDMFIAVLENIRKKRIKSLPKGRPKIKKNRV
ncbi:MAG: transposase [Spirochaetes bacterium]|nr:transposase [Spirochaetota bacterium]